MASPATPSSSPTRCSTPGSPSPSAPRARARTRARPRRTAARRRVPRRRSAVLHQHHGAVEPSEGQPQPLHVRDLPLRRLRRRPHALHRARRRPRDDEPLRGPRNRALLLARARPHDGAHGRTPSSGSRAAQRARPVVLAVGRGPAVDADAGRARDDVDELGSASVHGVPRGLHHRPNPAVVGRTAFTARSGRRGGVPRIAARAATRRGS